MLRKPVLLAAAVAAVLAVPAAVLAEPTSTQQDAGHTGVAPGPAAPLGKRWERDLGQSVGTPLVTGGRVFVVTGGTDGSSSSSSDRPAAQLRALSLDTGAEQWARAVDDSSQRPLGLAQAGGRIVAREGLGLRAYDAATGAVAWTVRPPSGSDGSGSGSSASAPRFTSDPVAADGLVYVVGTSPPPPARSVPDPLGVQPGPSSSSSPYSLYVLRASDGSTVRTADVAQYGSFADSTSHAIGLDGSTAYVTAGCGDAQAISRADGTSRWRAGPSRSSSSSSSSCSSPTLVAPVLAGGDVVVSEGYRGRLIVRGAERGEDRGAITAHSAPSHAGDVLLAPQESELLAQGRPGGLTRWTWRGSQSSYDGPAGSPLVAGGTVYVRNRSFVIGLRLSDGAEVWRGYVEPGAYSSSSSALPGMAAGDGHLLVPSASRLTAFWNGPDGPGLSTRPFLRGTLTARPEHTLRLFGQATTISASATPASGSSSSDVFLGHEVVLEADPFPFEGAYVRVATTRPDRYDSPVFRDVRPERNTLYRVVDPYYADAVSAPVLVRSDAGIVFPRPRVRGRTVRVRVGFVHSPQQRIAGRRAHVYVLRRGRRPVRRASAVVRQVSPTVARLSVRFRGRPRRTDRVYVCLREPVDDGYGRRFRVDLLCGRRVLPRNAFAPLD